jgi:DNA-binding HxlR family transcriptional regulator
MKKSGYDRQSQCPVDYAFQKIGGKYKARILWHLNTGTKRYGEIKKLLPDVTPKMLTQVLRELEGDQLIRRHVYLEVPPRVEYSLESSGEAMIPAIKLFSTWAISQMGRKGIPIFVANKAQMLEV